MSCYHPMIGVWKGEFTEKGKKKYDIIPGQANSDDVKLVFPDFIKIPCGHCIGCRLDYSRRWADRMMLELDTAGKGIFLTLTYDNEHLPVCMYDEDNNPLFATVDKRDCQLFMKSLRKVYGKCRFYLCSEYGPTTLRPHYHAIIFGLGLDDFDDLVAHGVNELGQRYYYSPKLQRIWKRGFVLLSGVSWKTCAYVARYVTKKLNGPLSIDYAMRNCLPEFSLMSRKPGIGSFYLDKHPDCLDYANINLSTPDGGLKIQIPQYFLRKLNNEKSPLYDPERYDKMIADRRKYANDAMILKLQKTGLSEIDYLEMCEDKKLDAIKLLKRRDV